MSENLAFPDLMCRVRAGDERAAAEVVRRYEPAVRSAVGSWLTHTELRRHLDAVDICQVVLTHFFAQVVRGRFVLDSPTRFVNLLKVMARRQLLKQRRALRTRRRGGGRTRRPLSQNGPPDPHADPFEEVVRRELLQEIQRRLSPEGRWLHEQRCAGRSWAAIAAEVGRNPDALRVGYARQFGKIARHFQSQE